MKKERHNWKKNIAVLLAIIMVSVLLFVLISGIRVKAAGFVDETIDAGNLYSRYGIDNYQLDYYVDMSWAWLPWNWDEGVEGIVCFNFYSMTNGIWLLSTVISNATGYVVQEAYRLDFIGNMADAVGRNIQTLAGVSEKGFASEGFYPDFLPFIILAVGCYAAYVGLIKRETSRALGAVANMLIIFVLSTSFIAFAPNYIRNINNFSSDISTESLSIGAKLVMPGSMIENSTPEDSVYLMRDSLFAVQVYQPWLILQYGTSDVQEIGEERVESVLGISPFENFGKDRKENVKYEIETYGNTNMTTTGVVKRFGMVFFVFVLNFIISIFVLLLCGMMILSQVMFLIFAMFLPVSFVLSMFPTYSGMAKKAVIRVFNIIMMRAGITLVVTVAFSISSMVYSLSSGYPFFLIAFLQITVFAGIYLKLGELLSMFGLQEEDNGRRRGGMMRSVMRYLVMHKLFGRHGGGNKRVSDQESGTTSGGNRGSSGSNGDGDNRQDRQPKLVGWDKPQTEDTKTGRYKMVEKSPHLFLDLERNGEGAEASSGQKMNVSAGYMEQYCGDNKLQRRIHGNEKDTDTMEQVSQNQQFKTSERTLDKKWYPKDGDPVHEHHRNTDTEAMKRCGEKGGFRQKRYKTGTDEAETVKEADMHRKNRTFKAAERSPRLAPEVDGNIITVAQRVNTGTKSMEKYRDRKIKGGTFSTVDEPKKEDVRKKEVDRKSHSMKSEEKRVRGEELLTGNQSESEGRTSKLIPDSENYSWNKNVKLLEMQFNQRNDDSKNHNAIHKKSGVLESTKYHTKKQREEVKGVSFLQKKKK